jgi:hypothetical protein
VDTLIGQEYRTFDGKRRWELLFEDMYFVILETGVKRGRDMNLVGVSTSDLRVKWVVGGEIDSPHQYDGIVQVYVRGGEVWASTWSCFNYRLNYRTGEILHREFTK